MIRFLDVSKCEVSDRGLQYLCLEDDGSTGCCNIETLSILKTTVTIEGVKNVVLFQKNLLSLKWEDSLSALAELAMVLQAEPNTRTFPLIDLGRVRVNNYSCFGDILLAVSICPKLSINKIKFECNVLLVEIMLNIFLSLPMLELRDVSFIGCETLFSSFEFGIVPVIQSIGANISILKISNFERVDPLVIVANCPNLKTLHLLSNKSYVESDPNFLPSLENPKHLENFRLIVNDPQDFESHLTESQLSFFFGSPQLNEIRIYNSAMLTDEAIEIAFKKTKFEKISTVDIACCESITNCGLDFFKREENSLSFISIANCFLVDYSRLEAEWTSMSLEKNWNVQTHFVFGFEKESDEELLDELMRMDE